MSMGPGTYHLDLPPSMDAVHPWFCSSTFNLVGPYPAVQPALEDDSYEFEAILQIKQRETHAKVKWIGYESSFNQWIKLSKLIKKSFGVVKTFSRGKDRDRVSLGP